MTGVSGRRASLGTSTRRARGLTQTQLAQAVGVPRSAVSHWEAPQGKNPSVKHLREISMVTGVQFEWLATGRGRMALSPEDALDTVAAADATLVDDAFEMRLVAAFRALPARSRAPLVELMEQMAELRLGRSRGRRVLPPS